MAVRIGSKKKVDRLFLRLTCIICLTALFWCLARIFHWDNNIVEKSLAKSDPESYFEEDIISRSSIISLNYEQGSPRNIHWLKQRLLLSVVDNSTNETSPEEEAGFSGYPNDIFTLEQKRNGAVVLHALGIVYMFIALAITSDEFFVPSLEVIVEKLSISEDVAGATFMAAGGSAPELFTSLIGTFISRNNVGIGTIVGSAVFNILFVIGACALCSRTVLQLTWWPLFRDISFYGATLILLTGFFVDKKIFYYESISLLLMYFFYVLFMKYNATIEHFVKSLPCFHNQIGGIRNQRAKPTTRKFSSKSICKCAHKHRHGVWQLFVHTIDPIGQEMAIEKARSIQNIAQPYSITTLPTSVNDRGLTSLSELAIDGTRNGVESTPLNELAIDGTRNGVESTGNSLAVTSQESLNTTPEAEMETKPKPIDISWPDRWNKRLTYVLLAPIVLPLWIFLPDVKKPEKKKYVAVTFCGSIMWIAIYSYLMVWWANEVGLTIGIPPEVMGITFLAAGTSIPDLITSVIVTKKGYGDMAISSSVGSNLFDVAIGLPFPWLLKSLIFNLAPVDVDSEGLFCSIALLLFMLVVLTICIAISKWRLSKSLGIAMFISYAIFLVISLLTLYNVIPCIT